MRQSVGTGASGGSGDGAGRHDRRRRVVAVAERDAARHRRPPRTPGIAAQRLEQLLIERGTVSVGVGYLAARQRELERQQRSGGSRADVLQPQQLCVSSPAPTSSTVASASSAGGEAVAQPRPRAARRARRLLEHVVQVGLRRVPRRREAEQQAGRRSSEPARTAAPARRSRRRAPAAGSAAAAR